MIQTESRCHNKYKINELPVKIDSYFNEFLIENPDIVADVESLSAYLEMTRDELNNLEGHKKVGRHIRLAKTKIAAIKKQLAYRGRINATMLAFDLKNDHGYREKPEEGGQSVFIFKGEVLEWGK
ncbi:MAG: hypothetical protein GX148_08730 [Clostridiales bacterium]|nr:hypothetical protein [Clostridiales bacterium]